MLQTRRGRRFEELTEKVDQGRDLGHRHHGRRWPSDELVAQDIARIISSTARHPGRGRARPGLAHRFFYDPAYGAASRQLLEASNTLLMAPARRGARRSRAGWPSSTATACCTSSSTATTGQQLVDGAAQRQRRVAAIAARCAPARACCTRWCSDPEGARALAELDRPRPPQPHHRTRSSRAAARSAACWSTRRCTKT